MNVREQIGKVSVSVMEHSGYKAQLMQADRLEDKGHEWSLPPGSQMPCIPIHCLPAAPDAWVRESGSYVVEVDCEHGLWFDWTMNDSYMTSIVPSVKGMNPITGQKIEAISLEQFRDKCPIHETDFAHGRYCEKCGYKWPAQNYVSYPNTLWWDGFRQPDGSVRQFFFTEEDQKDIASLVIGKENTVPAFGFAFFRCKKERMQEPVVSRGVNYGASITNDCYDFAPLMSLDSCESSVFTSSVSDDSVKMSKTTGEVHAFHVADTGPVIGCSLKSAKPKNIMASNRVLRSSSLSKKFTAKPKTRKTKDVSVGAGARIRQDLAVDTLPLNDWYPEEQAVIRLYFVFAEQLEGMVKKGGVVEIEGTKEGYLENLPVG